MSSFTYLVARCHGLRTRLISPSTLTSLVKVENVKSLAEALLKTEYGDLIREVPWNEINGFTLERIFTRKLLERCYFIPKIAPSSIVRFLYAYYRRFEVQNINLILRGKSAKAPRDRVEKSLIPIKEYSSINFDALLNSKDIVDTVKLLAETIYSPPGIVIQSYEDSGSLLPFEAYFEKVYASELMKTLEGVSGDKKYVDRLLRVEFDVRNCITTIGGVLYGLDSDRIESLIIPYSYKISIGDLVKVIRGERVSSIMKSVFSPYMRVVDSLLAGKEAKASVEGSKYIYDESENIRLSRAYGFAFVLTYLISCEVERRNLTSIALGKEYGITPDETITHTII